MKKAFTIVELLVAMALLAILIAISGLVFSSAVKAYRTAGAATEIAAKLSTVTDRLERDLQSLVPGMPIAIWFEQQAVDVNGDGIVDRYDRFDQIQFFSTGDTFESSRQWKYANAISETLSGNTARVYYGHANQVRISGLARAPYRNYNSAFINPAERATETILSRRVHLMTSLPMVPVFPSASAFFVSNFTGWLLGGFAGNPFGNDVFEYDNITLSDWTNILSLPANADHYLKTCFDNNVNNNDGRPGVDLTASDGQSLHMILAQGVGSFSIQWAYIADDMIQQCCPGALNKPQFNEIRWWPSLDPDGDGIILDSDFGTAGMNRNAFGCYMRFPSNPSPPTAVWPWYGISGCLSQTNWRFRSDYFPKALKFTFTLYDSNGVFKDGKTFTHIVYLND
jgi:prepilin-type N-terminal cleavage/methylation domain-containing protein